jgi:hypothetical protein
LEDLAGFGFTKDSPLHVEIANSFPVCVECWDGKTHQFAIQSGTTILQLRKRVGRKTETPYGLVSIECDGRVVCDYDVVKEVCVEGKRMKARLTDSSIYELFSPSGKITEESISKLIEEIKTMSFCELREIATKEFFSQLSGLMKQYEEDSTMTLLLTLLVEEIAYKGAIHSHIYGNNIFHSQFTESKCKDEFESRSLKQQGKENESRND